MLGGTYYCSIYMVGRRDYLSTFFSQARGDCEIALETGTAQNA